MKLFLSAIAALLLLLPASGAHAQQISRHVTVEYFQGPVVSSNRIIGLGGAYIGIAEGADGHLINPAAYATRYRYSVDDWFDYDWALSWINMPGTNASLNDAPIDVRVDSAQYVDFGFDLKFGRFGIGTHVAPRSFEQRLAWVDSNDVKRLEEVTWSQSAGGLGLAYAFLDGEVVFGVSILVVDLGLSGLNLEEDDFVDVNTSQLVWGLLVRPDEAQWRLGARLRTRALGESRITGDIEQFDLALQPTGVVAPWELGVGASWRWGAGDYNPRYDFSEKQAQEEPEAAGTKEDDDDDERYVLAAVDAIVTGKTSNAIGIESFIAQEYRRAGTDMTVGIRAGAEAEVVANRLRLRAGSYWEPSRYEGEVGRLHGTAGADLRVDFGWSWRLNAAVDVADEYLNYGLGVGFWH